MSLKWGKGGLGAQEGWRWGWREGWTGWLGVTNDE